MVALILIEFEFILSLLDANLKKAFLLCDKEGRLYHVKPDFYHGHQIGRHEKKIKKGVGTKGGTHLCCMKEESCLFSRVSSFCGIGFLREENKNREKGIFPIPYLLLPPPHIFPPVLLQRSKRV